MCLRAETGRPPQDVHAGLGQQMGEGRSQSDATSIVHAPRKQFLPNALGASDSAGVFQGSWIPPGGSSVL